MMSGVQGSWERGKRRADGYQIFFLLWFLKGVRGFFAKGHHSVDV
jgi:hypothetical protein